MAWDCGAVTTGPVTVPLVLSLGIGIAASAGKGDSSLSGFGVVTMASLFPIIAVLTLAIYVSQNISVEEIIASASTLQNVSSEEISKWSQTPYAEIIGGVELFFHWLFF